MDSSASGWGPLAACCEHNNDLCVPLASQGKLFSTELVG